MLEDWSGMDREKTKEYILKWQVYLFLVNFSCYPSFCNAFCNQMIPGSESHGELQNILYIVRRFPQKF